MHLGGVSVHVAVVVLLEDKPILFQLLTKHLAMSLHVKSLDSSSLMSFVASATIHPCNITIKNLCYFRFLRRIVFDDHPVY